MLTLSKLTYKRGKSIILKDISYAFTKGSITCITGQSGIGKSTLLSCVTSLIRDYEGTIMIGDTNILNLAPPQRASLIGLVFQEGNLFPGLTVLDNCTQPLSVVKNLSKKDAQQRASDLLTRLNIQDIYKYPRQLSGGQQQRVALARALLMKPKILCLDEPTAALDTQTTEQIVSLLKDVTKLGTTLIITSHDTSFVDALGDTVLELKDGTLIKKS